MAVTRCNICRRIHNPMLRECPPAPDMTVADVAQASKTVARQAKREGVTIAIKPTKNEPGPAAQSVAAAHGMTTDQLYALLDQLAKRRKAKADAQRRWRAKHAKK